MQDTLLQQGLDITLFGMGIVFAFLLVLVIGTSIMSRIITRNFPEEEPSAPVPGSASGEDARLRAIIKAAIDQHRKRR
ncbi:OadG family protein [Microbulbifer thermotolerans]|uniref:Probable oxaloacetate decarboxylase gamma chain n=1 Tax=Microbulbifer thermotolerans TaxID=252514 RepID=A0A143HMT1_MICTH|nr:OadG family protein [Microbulbifer thermotolerans]AMX02831.1 sodium pump decarboxylase subunit gamma [Microbulbifer thermotolerans]MCX2779695.1 OadG family protein [Microbulbifer thermotolerans]MCX2782662.1 OadG family protein [Microbulbifer thermotolerans]MCX2794675.1 OadG family protein [Microbulbifer thermotolerans]MCX2801502.1 OadG family protein [Microbulbifer thermotolerans]